MCVNAGPAHTPAKFGLPSGMRGIRADWAEISVAAAMKVIRDRVTFAYFFSVGFTA